MGVDLLSVAGHKLYAPKGIGALYIRQGTPVESFAHGDGHEGGRWVGTENIIPWPLVLARTVNWPWQAFIMPKSGNSVIFFGVS